ncbi:MAG TPA: hypothetical protein GXX23_00345 [Firmicutes bacterium]|nr:hypothetical protein [Candidatus Fermentithermobacillaceae bacterium]
MNPEAKSSLEPKKGLSTVEKTGLAVLAISLFGLFVNPGFVGGVFDAMVLKAKSIVSDVYLVGTLGTAVICSVMTGRILERLGLTDALLRVFMPLARIMRINPAVVVPGVYNILGDINAAGRISGPVLKKAKATKDEQKIAVCTMMQSQQSFSTFMLGLVALTNAGVWAFPVVIIGLFLPLIVVPWLLSKTLWRDTKATEFTEIPRMTPHTKPMDTVFGGAREGAELMFLLLVPAAAVIFAIIGALDYMGVWAGIQSAMTSFFSSVSIEPQTGLLSVLASPTLAMNTLKDIAANLDPRLVVGSFILAASGLPLQVVFGQIPAVWSQASDLTGLEAMGAAVLGAVLRILTAIVMALVITPLLI